jgi:hypothetical protein
MTSRKLQLNRETVRVLTSREMANIAGGEFPKSLVCGPDIDIVSFLGCPRPTDRCTDITKGCPIKK